MPKIQYIEKKFSAKSMAIIGMANQIIEEYRDDGLLLTLRQLYYQFVSRALIDNKQSEYKRLGSIISDGRLAGHIDWSAIEDRGRNLRGNTHWTDPGQIVRAAHESFQLDHWEGQEYHVEVWIEKEALVGVIASICGELDVPYFACKGYVSLSEMWVASERLKNYSDVGREPVIIHLGDHDPSGIDMTRDIGDRQRMFENITCTVERIALNMDQVEAYDPPPNPAKLTDSRCAGYINEYGDESWELDALNPRTLRDLISEKVHEYRDEDTYGEVIAQEIEYKDVLANVAKNWRTL